MSWLSGLVKGIPIIGGIGSDYENRRNNRHLKQAYEGIDKNLFAPIQASNYTGNDADMNQTQRNAISAMRQRAANGFTGAERAQMQGFNTQTNAATRGARENILSNARTQGSLTSGGTLGAQLAANEAGGMQKQQNQLGQAAQASKNAYEANQGLLDYDTAQRAQKFQQQLGLAQARANLQSQGKLFNYNIQQGQNQQDAANRQQNTKALTSLLALL